MLPIIELNPYVTDKIIPLYNKYRDGLPLHNIYESYIVRFPFAEGQMAVTVEVKPKYYRFTVDPQVSVLQMTKPPFRKFTVGMAVLSDGHFQYHEQPYGKDERDWLKKPFRHGNNASVLIELATLAMICFDPFGFALDRRMEGGTDVYSVRRDFEKYSESILKELCKSNKQKTLLDGWDNISLTEKQYAKVQSFVIDNNFMVVDLNQVALKRFCLALYKPDHGIDYWYYTPQGNVMEITYDALSVNSRYTFHIRLRTMEDGYDTELIDCDSEKALEWLNQETVNNREDGGTDIVKNWEWVIWNYFGINSFMLHCGDIATEVEEKVATQRTEHHTSKKRERNSVRLFKSYKLIKNWKTVVRKKAVITCPAWSVRGHFRHLRNGKVIFVEPFIKGPKKDEFKGKEYNLLPYKDA